jgi:hypothetical protein
MKLIQAETGQLIMANKNNTENNTFKRLSILVDQGGFSFYLHHDDTSLSRSIEAIFVDDVFQKKSLNAFQQKLKDICKTYSIKDIKLAFANEYFCLVPEEFYDENLKGDYLKFNVQLFEGDQITAEHISAIGAYLLYVPLMNYHNLVLEQVEEFEFIHFTQALLESAKSKSIPGNQKLKVFIRGNQLDVIAFDGKAFKMCNTFNYTSDLDIVYYILFAIEELKFDQYEMNLYITHNFEEEAWLELLKRYVQHVYSHKEYLTALI